jgi:hypothetical protein
MENLQNTKKVVLASSKGVVYIQNNQCNYKTINSYEELLNMIKRTPLPYINEYIYGDRPLTPFLTLNCMKRVNKN